MAGSSKEPHDSLTGAIGNIVLELGRRFVVVHQHCILPAYPQQRHEFLAAVLLLDILSIQDKELLLPILVFQYRYRYPS